jgi:membrane-bound hydrogenase subunit mbhJ
MDKGLLIIEEEARTALSIINHQSSIINRLQLWSLKKSIWVFHVNAGACNNCDIELSALTPVRRQRFGIKLVGSPRHADALLVTGVGTCQAARRLQEVYRQTAKPCVVFCTGACACGMGIFEGAYHVAGPVDEIIKAVDPNAIIAYVPGCPPKPQAIIAGVVKALGALEPEKEYVTERVGRTAVADPG